MARHESWKKHRRTQYRPLSDELERHHRRLRRKARVGGIHHDPELGTCQVVRRYNKRIKAMTAAEHLGLKLIRTGPLYRRSWGVIRSSYALVQPVRWTPDGPRPVERNEQAA